MAECTCTPYRGALGHHGVFRDRLCPVHGNFPLTSVAFDAKVGIKDGVNTIEEISNVHIVHSNNSNVVTFETALLGVVKQYYEGAITYGELMSWMFDNLPPPCSDPSTDAVYSPLVFGINFAKAHEKPNG